MLRSQTIWELIIVHHPKPSCPEIQEVGEFQLFTRSYEFINLQNYLISYSASTVPRLLQASTNNRPHVCFKDTVLHGKNSNKSNFSTTERDAAKDFFSRDSISKERLSECNRERVCCACEHVCVHVLLRVFI